MAVCFPVAACGGGGGSSAPPVTQPPSSSSIPAVPPPSPSPPPTNSSSSAANQLMVASNWQIGPIIAGQNYSVGTPQTPVQTGDGWEFTFPLSPGSVHYVTIPYGSLEAKTHIVMHYRVEAEPTTQFFPVCCANMLSIGPTLYFQQQGDDWNTDGMRWWASFNSPMPIKAGEYEIDVPLEGAWTSVFKMNAADNPQEFANAKRGAGRIGFTFGGGDGLGHGVYTNGNAKFVVTMFKVE